MFNDLDGIVNQHRPSTNYMDVEFEANAIPEH